MLAGLFPTDSDGDGLTDADETQRYGTNPLAFDADTDADSDGLTNVDEVDLYLTNRDDADSDDDGLSDGDEALIYLTDPLLLDTDLDGLSDGDEILIYGLSPLVQDSGADTDTDGLQNVDEVDLYFTDPLVPDADADTDGDGLGNVDEVDLYFMDPQVSDASADTDGDGLSNVSEVDSYGTNPQVSDAGADTDGDGLTNVSEFDVYFTNPVAPDADADTDGDGLENVAEVDIYFTNPQVVDADADTDGDGLTNVSEVDRYGTSPQVSDAGADSDGDGLTNVSEVDIYGTNPLLSDADADTDGDGLTNISEVDSYGTDPTTSDASSDTDGDGLTNVAEVDTHSTDPATPDTDADGLSDGEEINTQLTNPLVEDTDGDGFGDGEEVNVLGTDPLIPNPPENILNTNAAEDSGADVFASIETDGFGNWVSAWRSNEDLGGYIGSDYDILTSTLERQRRDLVGACSANTNASSDTGPDYWPPVVKTNRAASGLPSGRRMTDLGTRSERIGTSSLRGRRTTERPGARLRRLTRRLRQTRARTTGSTWPTETASSSHSGSRTMALADQTSRSSCLDRRTGASPGLRRTTLTSNSADDTFPTIASDGIGNWVAVWESDEALVGGDGDLFVSRSTDAALSWSTPAILNSNALSDSGQDLRPRLATDGFGAWLLVWDSNEDLGGALGSDRDVLFSRSTDAGLTWSAPTAIDFATASTDTGDELNPDLATDGTGSWTVVWETDEDLGGTVGTDWDLVVSRSVDEGLNWSAGVVLNSEAETDLGGNYFPRIASQPGGSATVSWHSDDNTNNAVGTDWDVFFAWNLRSDAVAGCTAPGDYPASSASLSCLGAPLLRRLGVGFTTGLDPHALVPGLNQPQWRNTRRFNHERVGFIPGKSVDGVTL